MRRSTTCPPTPCWPRVWCWSPRRPTGGAAAGSPAFVRLQDVSKQLEALISRSRGRPNKDLARLADQIKQVMENWEN